jgi:sucrose-6-phosphate hydrolase SacC (GH32 family)
MNDPHGMFQHTDGRVHLFFQYNPRALAWGACAQLLRARRRAF